MLGFHVVNVRWLKWEFKFLFKSTTEIPLEFWDFNCDVSQVESVVDHLFHVKMTRIVFIHFNGKNRWDLSRLPYAACKNIWTPGQLFNLIVFFIEKRSRLGKNGVDERLRVSEPDKFQTQAGFPTGHTPIRQKTNRNSQNMTITMTVEVLWIWRNHNFKPILQFQRFLYRKTLEKSH